MGRKGGVVIILVGAYRWPPGPRLNADPLPLACFFIGYNEVTINGNSIWMSLVRVNGG